jgi:hypothetical protein
MVAPDLRHPRRSQAEIPLIDLSEFGQPPLRETREDQYAAFNDNEGLKDARAGEARADLDKIREEASDILRRVRAAIETDRAIRWQPWVAAQAMGSP